MKARKLGEKGLIMMLASFMLASLLTLTSSARAGPPPQGPVTVEGVTDVAPVLNYQGRLLDPATGSPKPEGRYQMVFSIYDVDSGGTPLWSEIKSVTIMANGLFTTLLGDTRPLDPGIFDGRPLWLGVTVGSDPEATPRQRIAHVAYAMHAQHASGANELAGRPASAYALADHQHSGAAITSGTVAEPRIDPAIARDSEVMPLVLGGDGAGSGLDADLLDGQHGSYYQNASNINAGTLFTDRYSAYSDLSAEGYLDNNADTDLLTRFQADGRYWKLTGNSSTTPGTNFIGTIDNQALEFKVNGQRALRLEPNATSPNLIGGYSGNSVSAGVVGATIGGGGASGTSNSITANYGTIGGGSGNTASGSGATVGGGSGNTASGTGATVGGGGNNNVSGWNATVAGGGANTASNTNASVGGGYGNVASGGDAVVAGGHQNTASGYYATVPGGYQNTAQGNYSFAAGRRAKANNHGCFVWGDSTDANVTCDNDDRWVARASGGVYFYTSRNLASGSYLAAGGSSWNAVSNQAFKENFASVDTRQLLERLAAIPITTWNYKSQDPSIRHIGPMADDFNGLVDGLGGEGKDYINSLDADGVALAAIQGLYGLVREKDARIAELEAQNVAQQAQIDTLEARLMELEQRVGGAPVPVNTLPVSGLALGGLATLGAVVYWRRSERGRR